MIGMFFSRTWLTWYCILDSFTTINVIEIPHLTAFTRRHAIMIARCLVTADLARDERLGIRRAVRISCHEGFWNKIPHWNRLWTPLQSFNIFASIMDWGCACKILLPYAQLFKPSIFAARHVECRVWCNLKHVTISYKPVTHASASARVHRHRNKDEQP